MKDLVILVADKNMQFALRGALARPEALGIRAITADFRSHMGRDGGLQTRGFSFDVHGKPARPKEAMEALVRCCNLPRSASLYEKITSRISLRRCADPAFLRLRAVLRTWFPTAE